MRRLITFLLVIFVIALFAPTRAGHETPIYPSYYPQEIRIEPVEPASAADALREGRIQAYIGAEPTDSANLGEAIAFVESLGPTLVVGVNPDSPFARDEKSTCSVVGVVIGRLAGAGGRFRFHPYPVNPFHADYLQHYDLAIQARKQFSETTEVSASKLAVRAKGALAEKLVRAHWPEAGSKWDAVVEEIEPARLIAGKAVIGSASSGPPWRKEGWFQAYLLLAETITGKDAQARIESHVRRLQRGDYATAEERINLSRALVKTLTSGCRRVVAGYAIRREFYSTAYTSGVENIAFDSQAGFNSAIFIRTVKLKDFPWNGWLSLGVSGKPDAAWNPVAGFTDEAGRLIWQVLGDPAAFPEPYNAGWSLNRVADVKATTDK